MVENRNIICTGCPMGCNITVKLDDGKIKGITGNTCKHGASYAMNEVINPKRTLTTTVKTSDGKMLPVKTSEPMPKDKLFEAMELLKGVCVSSHVKMGEIIVKNILDTGVDVVSAEEI